MDNDIFNDMIDYGDDVNDTPDSTKRLPLSEIREGSSTEVTDKTAVVPVKDILKESAREITDETATVHVKESVPEITDETAVVPVKDIREKLSDNDTESNTQRISPKKIKKEVSENHRDRADYMADDNSNEYFSGDDEEDNPFENIPMPEEHYSYDFEYDDIDDNELALVVPMLKTILKWLIPFLAVIIAVIFIMTSPNSAIEGYRHNFTNNITNIMHSIGISSEQDTPKNAPENSDAAQYKEVTKTENKPEPAAQYRTGVEKEIMINFEDASASQFIYYENGVICAKTNYLCYIDKQGNIVWEKNTPITSPILKAEGEYFLVAQKGGTKFSMYCGENAVYDSNTEHNILTGNVSSNGDVVLVTEKPGYKGAVTVYNKRGDTAFAWSSGSASIISADISPKSRHVAVSLLNTDKGAKSSVYLFDIKKEDSYAQQSFDDSIVYNVDFKGNSLNIFSDTALYGMSLNGNIKYSIDYGSSEPTRCSINDNGDKLVLFTGTNIPMINIYSSSGKLQDTISTSKIPGFAYIKDDIITYTIDREVYSGTSDMRIPYRYTALMDINEVVPIDKKCFMVIYSNSVSVVNMKGLIW